jgi:hypothetical protein
MKYPGLRVLSDKRQIDAFMAENLAAAPCGVQIHAANVSQEIDAKWQISQLDDLLGATKSSWLKPMQPNPNAVSASIGRSVLSECRESRRPDRRYGEVFNGRPLHYRRRVTQRDAR